MMRTLSLALASALLAGCGFSSAPFNALVEQQPPCDPISAPEVTLDLDEGCYRGACAGMTYAEISEALGEEGALDVTVCDGGGGPRGFIVADWSAAGVSASFFDNDADGVPDEGQAASGLRLQAPASGATVEGLGLGASMSCFINAHGNPDTYSVSRDSVNRYRISGVVYARFIASDTDQDGEADAITLLDEE